MTTATLEKYQEAKVVTDHLYRMSYETYEQIAELGMIRPEEHVVLLDGILVQTMTKGSDHSSDVIEGFLMLTKITPDGWHVRPEQPIVIRNGPEGDSAPEPDLAIVVGRNGNFKKRQPEAGEVSIVVELASSPAAFATDRAGLRRYARASIPTALIVTLYDSSVHIFTEPNGSTTDPTYAHVVVKRPGEQFDLLLRGIDSNAPAKILGPIAVNSFFSPDL